MSLEFHRRAESMMVQADQLARQGEVEQAAARYRAAAAEEAEAYERLPPDWHRTRGVLAVSSVALYRKGRDLGQAVRRAQMYLDRDELPEFARLDLQAIINEIRADLGSETTARDEAPRELTVGTAIRSYIDDLEPSERPTVVPVLNSFGRWFGLERNLAEIDVVQLERYQDQLAASGVDPTVRLEPLRAFLSDARSRKLIPVALANFLKVKRRSAAERPARNTQRPLQNL